MASLAGRLDIRRVQLLGREVALRDRVVGGPGVPHRRRHVEQVAGMDGGPRQVAPDGIERGLVPDPRRGPVRVPRSAHRPRPARRSCRGKTPGGATPKVIVTVVTTANKAVTGRRDRGPARFDMLMRPDGTALATPRCGSQPLSEPASRPRTK